ncbi:MAG: alkaline phosphatase family protein [Rikenellaceae bacterium]|nr:alkaline phosphatase family protein [Rikenellaceae bacterium]
MRRILVLIAVCLTLTGTAQETPPKLVVNIVVSSMRYDYLKRFEHYFSEQGFRTLLRDGINCTNTRYDYMGNNTPAGITTLLSGSNPATHGIVSDRWLDYTTNDPVYVISDKNYYGLGCVEILGQYAPTQLTTSTLGDELKRHNPLSRVISIALEPVSGILGGGRLADAAYWFDPFRGNWCTSTYYMDRLPNWVDNFNQQKLVDSYNQREWSMYRLPSQYVYSERSEIVSDGDRNITFSLNRLFRRKENDGYFKMQITPMGVDMMMEFVKQTIIYESLGKDDYPDMLTVTIDPFRYITETYGTEAIETEDALYRLDENIAGLIEFTDIQLGKNNTLFIVTADHGSSDTYREKGRYPGGRFNVMQFKVLINGFLNTQYGVENWVVDYANSSLYLNHRVIFEKGLNLAEIQSKVAAFALQFRGVAQALTGTGLQNNYYGGGALQKIQHGYYPKHSGDVILNLMPGWIEEQQDKISLTGSIYEYDTHVPLLWYGARMQAETIHTPVSMTDVTPTLARILGISLPDAATGTEIIPITRRFAR